MSGALEALLADEERRAREFPITRTRAFFAHAAVGPLPRAVAQAMQTYIEGACTEAPFEYRHANAEEGARRLAAGLIGASAAEVAFVPSTSAGLSLVAAGLDWRPGDRVLVREGDFPANLHPWLALRERGVVVDLAPWERDGTVRAEDVARLVGPRTRLVALSSVDYVTGTPLAVDEFGSLVRSRGALFCLDAIQSLGALPVSVEHVDFLAADAHKWLLGPQGAGLLYVRGDRLAELRPVLRGWHSVADPRDFTSAEQPLADSARRFEPGGLNAAGVVGLHAALECLATYGARAIAARVGALRARIHEGLEARGRSPLGPRGAREVASGIVSFGGEPDELRELHRRLDREGIVTSLRAERTGAPCIRLAPHFYTSDADVARLLEALA